MLYPLEEINLYIEKLAEIIKEVLLVDVEIIDSSYVRIAGTGKYKDRCGENTLGENLIIKEVFERGKKQVVENPGLHRICSNCSKKNSCPEKFECAAPILMEGEVIGVISLICFKDDVKKVVLDKLKEYSDFIEKMSELISLKLKESMGMLIGSIKDAHKTLGERNGNTNYLNFNSILGCDESFVRLKEKGRRIARNDASVLILGESGTGKELFARAIHFESKRRENPFIAINCGAIPEALLESELFGYAPYAFSGASKNGRDGKFKLAHKGTIFLDEIGDMPYKLQVKLLRVLQEKAIVPVGSNKMFKIDVRVISASNKNLEEMVINKEFREDLFYRLNVIPIEIPPLRNRQKDILLLTKYFTQKYSKHYGILVPDISKEVIDVFYKYEWRGNVRELENTVEYIVNVIGGDKIVRLKHLPDRIYKRKTQKESSLCTMEKSLILEALGKYGCSTSGKENAAKALGISLSTLYRKMDKYCLEKNESYV